MPFDAIGLYIHLPWCVQKCPYCDFNSHALKQELPEHDYVKAIISDLEFEAVRLKERTIRSIFFGGGTPSLFSGQAIANILDATNKHYNLANDIEITLEANPGTAEAHHFHAYHAAGVNRLSLGLQSLDDSMLERLGRIHTALESRQAYEMARSAGFDNINLDLMFGLPGQDIEQGMNDLEAGLSLNPEHLSWYQLTLEPNTQFAAQPPDMPDDDICYELQMKGIERLSSLNYARYEVSAYAKPGLECRHNMNYWRFGDYLGIGAGAHSKITHHLPARTARYKHPGDYMRTAGTPDVYQQNIAIASEELLFEYLLNRLRLVDGFLLQDMQSSIGITPQEFRKVATKPLSQGLLSLDETTCRTTDKGFRYLNEILLAFLPAKIT